MYNLIALAQVLLVFVIMGAVAVYVLDIMSNLGMGANATLFLNRGFEMFDILGNFGKVVVVVAIVAVLVSILGIRMGAQG